MKCECCNTTLKKLPKTKGRKNLYQCPKCKCLYVFVVVRKDSKCPTLKDVSQRVVKHLSLRKEKLKRKRKRKGTKKK